MYTTFEQTVDLTEPLVGESIGLFYSSDLDGTVQDLQIVQTYPDGAHLNGVADQIRRFLLAAGYTYVTDVVIESESSEFRATEAE